MVGKQDLPGFPAGFPERLPGTPDPEPTASREVWRGLALLYPAARENWPAVVTIGDTVRPQEKTTDPIENLQVQHDPTRLEQAAIALDERKITWK